MRYFHKHLLLFIILNTPYLYCKAQGSSQKQDSTSADETPFTIVEEMPQFPGGEEAMINFLRNNLKFPPLDKNTVLSRVYINFVVDKNGDIVHPKIIRGMSGAFDEEALRVIRLMPKWIPGKQNGKQVAVYYNLPINFSSR